MRNPRNHSLILLFLVSSFSLFQSNSVLATDSAPPITVHTFEGDEGNDSWFTSNVDVTLRASDLESGPGETHYYLNSDEETVQQHVSGQNEVVNPSFESGWFFSINNWSHSGGASFWQSFVFRLFNWRSAVIGDIWTGSEFVYWHNRDSYIPTMAGDSYTVSSWVKGFDLQSPGAWMEIWGKATNSSEDQLLSTSEKITGNFDWTMLSTTFVMPSGFQGVYVKLGFQEDNGLIGLVAWEGVSLYGGYSALSEFTVVENGEHSLHYYSLDNAGNTEAENVESLKIDTVPPHDWQEFNIADGGSDHSYYARVEVFDEISGIDVSTASYRWYTDHQDQGWSCQSEDSWDAVDSVTLVSDGSLAVDGEKNMVKLQTPVIDFGDSSTVMKVQFRIGDVAGSSADSPVYILEGAWMQSEGGFIYSKNGVNMSAPAISGQSNTDSAIMTNGEIYSFNSADDWQMKNYIHEFSTVSSLFDIVGSYADLQSEAIALPSNRLPEADGIYSFSGDYVIDQNSTPSGFEDNIITTVVLIDGDLTIKKDYRLNASSAVVFIVEGDVLVSGHVEEIFGFFISSGIFNTNYDNKQNKQLSLQGGAISLSGFNLLRDLTAHGNPSNGESPAEIISLPYAYFFNETLPSLWSPGNSAEYTWLEVP